jgi:DNA-binding GntR family transcriptional regulator
MSSNIWRIEAPKTAGVRAYDLLRRAIIDGRFPPGERLTEVGVASLLGISRTPVREAIARLIKDGLLRNTRGVGIEVVDPRMEFLDIYYIREMIEGCAARLAAMRATSEEAAEIVALAKESHATDPADVETRARLNEAFHLRIADAGHAPRLERLVRDYRDLFASPRMLKLYSSAETRRALDDHRRIASAIAAGDGDAAELAMREHLRHAYALGLRTQERAERGRRTDAPPPRKSGRKTKAAS